MNSFVHDGIVFDLGRDYMDVTGVVWTWTTMRNQQGEPLMCSRTPDGLPDADEPVIALPDLYRWHGPLIPVPQPIRAAMMRRALEAA